VSGDTNIELQSTFKVNSLSEEHQLVLGTCKLTICNSNIAGCIPQSGLLENVFRGFIYQLSGARMPTHADAYSDGQLSEYSYTESYDTIDELLKRFTLDYTPEYSIKLREKCVLMAASVGSSRAERLDNF
jgi:hypothetical protein